MRIATFTYDLCTSVATQYPGSDCFVVPINDISSGYDYPAEVRFEIEEQEVDSYLRAADFLNFANADIVCLQHEYGIYGGPAGTTVVAPAARPAHANCHHAPHGAQGPIQRTASRADSDRRPVSPAGRDVRGAGLSPRVYDVPEAKIDLIAHGIPDMPSSIPTFTKTSSGSRASS